MLRLIIVDDEKIIRETIFNIIDWNSMGVEVIGLCKNGIEAFDMILDENPDIVISDIKMPGLSGLELIKRVSETELSVEFIILSGYGEFDYAKKAMKYGVKNYLLKPCNESQIIEVIKDVSEDCYKKRAFQDFKENQYSLTKTLHENIIRNIITEGLSSTWELSELTKQYEKFMDFTNKNYELCYIYYLDEEHLLDFIQLLYDYNDINSPSILLFTIYVKNTLLVFFESYQHSFSAYDNFVESIHISNQKVSIQYERKSYISLNKLLEAIIGKLKRFEMIYVMKELKKIPICNYNVLFHNVEEISKKLVKDSLLEREKAFDDLKNIFNSLDDVNLMNALITNILLKQLNTPSNDYNPIHFTEFMLDISSKNDIIDLRESLYNNLSKLLKPQESTHNYKSFIEKTLTYIDENLSNPNLSLKWISENLLFLNVDYVSKQFLKQTGYKFSSYLTNVRIEKAKILLLKAGIDKIYFVAEEVGYGNNPQYFSQIFKKNTGMTPTMYIKKMTT